MSETYEGWSNRETWAVALYLHNEEPLYLACLGATQRAWDRRDSWAADKAVEPRPQGFVADALEEIWDQYLSDVDDHCSEDLFFIVRDCGSHWRVDWREIAQNFMECVDSKAQDLRETEANNG